MMKNALGRRIEFSTDIGYVDRTKEAWIYRVRLGVMGPSLAVTYSWQGAWPLELGKPTQDDILEKPIWVHAISGDYYPEFYSEVAIVHEDGHPAYAVLEHPENFYLHYKRNPHPSIIYETGGCNWINPCYGDGPCGDDVEPLRNFRKANNNLDVLWDALTEYYASELVSMMEETVNYLTGDSDA